MRVRLEMFDRRRQLSCSAGLAAMLALIAGCGSDAGQDADVSEAAVVTTAASSADGAAPVEPSSEPPVMVEAYDYKFEAIPDDFPAGVQLTLTNLSNKEVHELVAFRLPDAETRPVADLMALPEAELGGLFGGEPATVIIAPPESDGSPVVGSGVLSEPGRYIFVCMVPTGADPEEFLAAV